MVLAVGQVPRGSDQSRLVSGDRGLEPVTTVLELVTRSAPGAEAEVVVRREDLALTRFANSYINQNVADASVTVRLRLFVDGRTAAGSTTRTDPDGLHQLVDRTLAAARLTPPDPGWPGLAPPAPLARAGTVDEAVVSASPADRADLVRAFVEAAGGLTIAGFCSTRYRTMTFANSAGQVAQGASTEVVLDGVARLNSADGVARNSAARLSAVDGAVLGARAAAKTRASADPVELPPGRYEVVLEPTAVYDVLQALGSYGFSGRAVNERRSVGSAQGDLVTRRPNRRWTRGELSRRGGRREPEREHR